MRLIGIYIFMINGIIPSAVRVILRKIKDVRSEFTTLIWAMSGLIFSTTGLFFSKIDPISNTQ